MIAVREKILKKILSFTLANLISLTIVACGGGGSDSSLTPLNSPVKLAEIRKIEEVTATPGTVLAFKMTGTITDGISANNLSATFSTTIKQPMTIEGETYNVSEHSISVTNTTAQSSSSSKSASYVSAKGSFSMSDSGVIRTVTASSQKQLPFDAAVGDSGSLGTVSFSDGITEDTIWRIDQGYNGSALLKLSFNSTDNLNNPVYKEEDSYTILPDGTVSALAVKLVDLKAGLTMTLSGKRFYAVYGRVTAPNGTGVSGVTININQGSSSPTAVTTDANGDYTIPTPQNGPITLTPSCPLTTSFTPAKRAETFNNADVMGMDFTINDSTSPVTNDATAVTDASAEISGSHSYSQALGFDTVWLEYGTTIYYGNKTNLLSTSSNMSSYTIRGLQPLTTYHYRIVTSINGINFNGDDKTFTTLMTPLVLAAGLDNPYHITLDTTNLYWTESAAVKKMGKTGGAVTTLASGLNTSVAIAVDSTNVYWVDISVSTIMKTSINGGPVTILASTGSAAPSMALEGTTIYWPDQSGIYQVGINGGASTFILPLLLPAMPLEVVADATSIYWTTYINGAIMKYDINSGTVTTIVDHENNPHSICVDSSGVYWSASESIKKTGLNGGTVTTLATESGYNLVLDATSVYWVADMGIFTGTSRWDVEVRRVAKNGGPVTTLATIQSTETAVAHGVAVDDTNIYWTEPNYYQTNTGMIKAVPKDYK